MVAGDGHFACARQVLWRQGYFHLQGVDQLDAPSMVLAGISQGIPVAIGRGFTLLTGSFFVPQFLMEANTQRADAHQGDGYSRNRGCSTLRHRCANMIIRIERLAIAWQQFTHHGG